ncbi:MAG: hypothetical protein QHH07_02035 [Sedimentisphaerales bacterium]|nr:hypothetical protein [Sedimentisphaerales bacterium]
MRIQNRTALGIEISTRHVAMALVRWERRRFVLINAAKVQTQEELIKDGQVQDPAAITRAIRQARSACLGTFGYAYSTGLCLPAGLARLHLLDLPEPLPANLGMYVRDEVGQFSNIPAERMVCDFAPIGPKEANRLIAAVADTQPIMGLIRPCATSRLVVQHVAPGCMATSRSLQEYLVRSQAGNVLVITIDPQGLALCAWREGHWDFARAQPASEHWQSPDALTRYIAGQIHEIIQFYTVEASGPQPWRICLVCPEGSMIPSGAEGMLVPGGIKVDLEIVRPQEVLDTVVQCRDRSTLAQTSLGAVGLALGLLTEGGEIPTLNLLPPQVLRTRKFIRQVTVAGLVAALVIPAMALVQLGLVTRIRVMEEAIAGKRALVRAGQTAELASQHRQLEQKIDEDSKAARFLQELVGNQRQVDWAGLLEELMQATPSAVAVRQLTCQAADQPLLLIDGYAVDYPSIRLFVEGLGQSRYIASASLVRSGVDVVFGKTQLAYQIRCVLKPMEP